MKNGSEVCSLRAHIGKVVDEGSPLAYVVAYPISAEEAERFGFTAKTSITFYRSLLPKDTKLMNRQIVLLSEISEHVKGWRAAQASLVEAQAQARGR